MSQEILESVSLAYATCHSYSDRANVKLTGVCGSDSMKFETHFVRPNDFRFEWISYHPYFKKAGPKYQDVIGSKGEKAYFRLHIYNNEIREAPDLGLAIACATGISNGTAHFISSLLMTERFNSGNMLTKLTEVTQLEDETISTQQCHHVFGKRTAEKNLHSELDLWIDKELYLTRRLRQTLVAFSKKEQREERFTVDAEFIEPEINCPIDERIFDPNGEFRIQTDSTSVPDSCGN